MYTVHVWVYKCRYLYMQYVYMSCLHSTSTVTSFKSHWDVSVWNYMEVSWRFPEIGVPEIINFSKIFHYKPSIFGYRHFSKPLYHSNFISFNLHHSTWVSLKVENSASWHFWISSFCISFRSISIIMAKRLNYPCVWWINPMFWSWLHHVSSWSMVKSHSKPQKNIMSDA